MIVVFIFILLYVDWESEVGVLFIDNCVLCYGDLGIGDCELGVFNFVDVFWFYGGD